MPPVLTEWTDRIIDDCACGRPHRVPIRRIVVGPEAADAMRAHIEAAGWQSVLLVADEQTAGVGHPARQALAEGLSVREMIYDPSPPPMQKTADALFESLRGQETDVVCAVGSGTISDLAKYAAERADLPLVTYPTAASVNGYTSSITALKVDGLKSTLPATPPDGVFADPAVVATAPNRMTAAGLADLCSKPCSGSDWFIAHSLRDEFYCPLPNAMLGDAIERLVNLAPALKTGRADAMALLLEALLLSGIAMVLAGKSSPASGGEHLISHYIDMRAAFETFQPDLHGAQVGLGILHCLDLYAGLQSLLKEGFDPVERADRAGDADDIAARIHARWPDALARSVEREFRKKWLNRDERIQELTRLWERREPIRDHLEKNLIPTDRMRDAIRSAGGPVRPEQTGIPREIYDDARREAFTIRSRLTILDLARPLGLGGD